MPFFPRLVFPKHIFPLSEFKGHQKKALDSLNFSKRKIDLVLEVRDARAPISTKNRSLNETFPGTERVILYSKRKETNINTSLLAKWHAHEKYMMIDCRDKRDAQHLVQFIKFKYHEMDPPPPLGIHLLIVGMPNVGKSTLVNTLKAVGMQPSDKISTGKKNKKVAKTGDMPGVTRKTSEVIRLSHDPNAFLIDTPGISIPHITDHETMLSLSLAGTVNSTLIDPVIQADYLLFLLNLQDPSGKMYKKFVPEPTNSINRILKGISRQRGKKFNETEEAIYFINYWRKGKGGKVVFDKMAIERYTNFLETNPEFCQMIEAQN